MWVNQHQRKMHQILWMEMLRGERNFYYWLFSLEAVFGIQMLTYETPHRF